jgi:hypothetical protein
MTKQPITLRSYKKSFSAPRVRTISRLIDELGELGGPLSGYKIYTSEIQGCLSVGLLLAALSVSTSMLELFVRDLAVAYRLESHYAGDMKLRGRVQREIEEDRQATFDSMLKELELTVITPKDGEALRAFYRETRIPIAHALLRRMTRDGVLDIFELPVSSRDLEERLEDAALAEIKFVVETVKNYRPWLLGKRP